MKASTRTGSTLGLAAAVAVLVLSGCGSPGMSGSEATAAPSPTAEATAEATAAPVKILIKGFKYQDPQTVSPGSSINVTNEDIEAHTITADAVTVFDVVIKPGTDTFTAPTEPGTYPYHCIFHGNMRGTLTVK